MIVIALANLILLIVIFVRVRWLVYGLQVKNLLIKFRENQAEDARIAKDVRDRTAAERAALRTLQLAEKTAKNAGSLWAHPQPNEATPLYDGD